MTRRTAQDWALLFGTVAAFTAVCGAYLGHVWPDGLGGAVTFTISAAVALLLLRLDYRWDP